MSKRKTKIESMPVFVSGGLSPKDFRRINEFHDKYKRGDYTKVADLTMYDPSYVWRVLNNERGQNKTIISTARRIVRNRKTQRSDYNW